MAGIFEGTKIPRSQAYSMVTGSRTNLPSRPDQVREFVEACGLAPVQVGQVMDLWGKLDQQAREQAAVRASSPVRGLTASVVDAELTYLPGTSTYALSRGSSRARRRRGAQDSWDTQDTRRPATGADLLFLILDDPRRTRRALQLLIPITLAFVVIVTVFVVWAIVQPDYTSVIIPVLAAILVLPFTTLRRLVRR